MLHLLGYVDAVFVLSRTEYLEYLEQNITTPNLDAFFNVLEADVNENMKAEIMWKWNQLSQFR